MSSSPTLKSNTLRDVIILVVLTLIVALPGLARIPAIDRDEARYAQATVQMLQTGEYVDIRFQEDPRWKKPAGAYWAQALSVSLLSDEKARAIWAHRLPSVIGALMMVVAVYFGGTRLVGARAGLIGAALLAVSLSLTYEAHAAKTDALLGGFSAVCFAALAYLRASPTKTGGRWAGIIFWASLGAAIMMKGPITPIIAGTAIAALFITERDGKWLKPLAFPIGPLLCLAIALPWMVLIYQKTGGAFFSTAVSEDLAPKLAGGAEKHGGPLGYYLMTVWIIFWPGIAFLVPGLVVAARTLSGERKRKKRADATETSPYKDTLPAAIMFLLAWALPWWLIVEIAPTKLPHYTLPVYPSLAVLGGIAAASLFTRRPFAISRRIGALAYGLIGLLLTAGVILAQGYFSAAMPAEFDAAQALSAAPLWLYVSGAIIAALICAGVYGLWAAKGALATSCVIASGAALWALTFGLVMPSLTQLTLSKQVEALLIDNAMPVPLPASVTAYSPQFSEPSLVYHLGTHIKVGENKSPASLASLGPADLLIADMKTERGIALLGVVQQAAMDKTACFNLLGDVHGQNYSKGDVVTLRVLQKTLCPSE